MTEHTTGTREEAAAAQDKLLEREDELMRLGEELAEERRKLPWVPVEKEYTLDTDEGPKTLTELFDGRSQLLVYHIMFGPDWSAACRPARRSPTTSTARSRISTPATR